MKKTLVALALAAFASTSYATVAGSAHDFNASTTYTTNQSSRCQYCHVPHGAVDTWAGTALWAIQTQPVVTDYYSAGITAVEARRSLTCLACHGDDATTPTDQFGRDVLQVPVAGEKSVGLDLTDDHPIGDTVQVIPGFDGMKDAPLTLGRTTFPTAAPFRTVQCATCHSVHGQSEYTIIGRKLLYGPGDSGGAGWDPTTTDFCNICHDR